MKNALIVLLSFIIVFVIAINETVELGVLAFTGAILGYFLKASLEKKNERETREFIKKEGHYKKFLALALEGFFEGWEEEGKNKEFFRELNTDALLYASDDVLKKAYNFQYCFDNSKTEFPREESDKYYKELVISIRKELMKLQGKKTNIEVKDIDIRKLN